MSWRKVAEPADVDAMSPELHLAAIVSLLSSTALHGATAGKLDALRAHLEAAALCVEPLDPCLRQSLEDALAHWLSVDIDGPACAAVDDDWSSSAVRRLH